MKNEWRKYANARDQLYNLSVKWSVLVDGIPAAHRTDELVQVLEMVDLIIGESLRAFGEGQVLAMQLDRYEVIPLPGFEDYDAELKSPPDWRED